MKIRYKKVPNNENAIEVDGKVVLSFDPKYKEYLKWKDENPGLEQELLNEIGQEIENKRLYKLGAPHKSSDKWKWYNESGQLILESKISTNKENSKYSEWDIDGEYISWYDNGQKESEGNILKGKKDGKWTVWYENGKVTEQVTYKNGKPVGKLDRWHPSGVKEREIIFDENGLVTEQVWWYENGQQGSTGKYKNGVKFGRWIWWHESGEKWGEGQFEDRPVRLRDLDPNDYNRLKFLDPKFSSDELKTDKWTYWHKNGNKFSEGIYKDGEADGTWRWWYNNGQKEKEETYVEGNLKGKYVNYYRNGKMRSEGQILGGEMDGKWLFYFHNEKKEMECNFDFGMPIDIAKIYHDSGELVREIEL